MKNIIVIGLGSMGKRRLWLLKKLRPELRLCGVDTDARRCSDAGDAFGIATYPTIAEAVAEEQPEAAVISTSPLSHAAIIRECLGYGLHIFTELNLVSDGYEENMALAKEKGRVLFLSSTPLYRDEMRYVIERVKQAEEPLSYRYHVGQYLPDWHPWESYQNYFVGDARTNGCREILAVELPWLCAAFGSIADVQAVHQKNSTLNVSYDDSYMLLLRHETGHMGSLCIDVVSRKPVRNLEVFGESLYLTWDGTPDSLKEWDISQQREKNISLYDSVEHQDGYAAFVVENAYAKELDTFLATVEHNLRPYYSFEENLSILALIDRIEVGEKSHGG